MKINQQPLIWHKINVMEILEFKIPNYALCYLINNDCSGNSEEDIIEIDNFVNSIVNQFGNANFSLPSDNELDLGFLTNNDINNLGCDCSKLLLIPTNIF